MKYLRKHFLHENIDVNKFKSYINELKSKEPLLSDYEDLSYILSDEFMDDMGITSQTKEVFGDDYTTHPTNKFWGFYGICKNSNDNKMSSVSTDFERINYLVIYNIGELEIEEVKEIINDDFLNKISKILGYRVSAFVEEVYNEEYECYLYDIEFKLNKLT
jgi:hypothetical protein